MSLRIGSVPFLNAKPLLEGLQGVELESPAKLAEKLRAGALDVALVPVMEVLEHGGYRLIDGIGIASQRLVRSVIIAYNKPLYEVKTIAEDAQSKTSNALGRLIVERDYGNAVKWVKDGEEADGQLMIGDRALAWRKENPAAKVLDLARSWYDRRQLPFLFAAWAVAPSVTDVYGLTQQLQAAKKTGLRRRPEYAHNEDDLRYLTENIHYDVGPLEKEALKQFERELIEMKLLKKAGEWSWV